MDRLTIAVTDAPPVCRGLRCNASIGTKSPCQKAITDRPCTGQDGRSTRQVQDNATSTAAAIRAIREYGSTGTLLPMTSGDPVHHVSRAPMLLLLIPSLLIHSAHAADATPLFAVTPYGFVVPGFSYIQDDPEALTAQDGFTLAARLGLESRLQVGDTPGAIAARIEPDILATLFPFPLLSPRPRPGPVRPRIDVRPCLCLPPLSPLPSCVSGSDVRLPDVLPTSRGPSSWGRPFSSPRSIAPRTGQGGQRGWDREGLHRGTRIAGQRAGAARTRGASGTRRGKGRGTSKAQGRPGGRAEAAA